MKSKLFINVLIVFFGGLFLLTEAAMTELVFNNKAYGNIKGGITSTDTEIELYPGHVNAFYKNWESGKAMYLTITDKESEIETVLLSDIDGNTLTVSRGQDGTSAKEWPSGAVIVQRLNAASLESFIQREAYRVVAYNPNGTLPGDYVGEKVYQSSPIIRWWKNISGTDWQLIAGSLPADTDLSPVVRDEVYYSDYNPETTWDTVHDATDGTATGSGGVMAHGAFIKDAYNSYELHRGFISFDLSSYSDPITSATIKIYMKLIDVDSYGDGKINFYEGLWTGASPVEADYDNFGSILFAQADIANTDWAWIEFDLNDAGLSYLNSKLGSEAKFCFRDFMNDICDIDPKILGEGTRVEWEGFDWPDHTYTPKLSISFT